MWRTSLLLFALASVADAQENWWNQEWSHRRVVATGETMKNREPSDVAFVEITTQGKMREDGADVRVIDAKGAELPRKVITASDDKATVLFPAQPKTRYTIYWGNERAEAPAAWEPVAGLVLEVRERPKGPAGNWEQAKKLLETRTRAYGRMMVPSIAYGFNPLGPPNDVLVRFTGWLGCPEDGEYEFATNSWDASFLLVDGKVIAEWPGWHDPIGGAEGHHSGKVTLAKGRHKVEYVNVTRDKGFGCAAGWKPPSAKRIAPIPHSAWIGGLGTASLGYVESRAGGPMADFGWQVTSDLGLEDRGVTCVQFSARNVEGAVSFRWDFGDGTESTDRNPLHIFLENGVFAVRLEATMKDGAKRSGANRVRVQPQRNWGADGVDRRNAQYADIVKGYPAEKLSPAAALEMGRLCLDAGRKDAALAGLAAALEKGAYDFREAEHRRLAKGLYDLHRERRSWAKAAAVCDAVLASKLEDRAARAYASIDKGEALMEAGELDGAAEIFKAVLAGGGKTDYARLAKIRTADVLLAQGKKDEARAIYSDVEEKWRTSATSREMARGNHSVAFHGYLENREFEAAEKEVRALVWDTTTAQLTGFPRYLTGQLREAQGRWEDAAGEFERAVAADPDATHAADALLRLAKALEKLGRKDAARAALERCAREYPESPCADAARKELERVR
jgi:TolA-binding protein